MAAPRKYSDAQRHAVYRLHEGGMKSEAIAEACERGTASTAPFRIPRRSVSAVIEAMARESGTQLPSTVGDSTSLEAVQRFPMRIAEILDAEIERLAKKQSRGKLTAKDIDQLRKAAEVSGPLSKRLAGVGMPSAKGQRGGREPGPTPAPESAIERLAREEAQTGTEAEPRLSPTHTRRPPELSVVTDPDVATESAEVLDAMRAAAEAEGATAPELEQAFGGVQSRGRRAQAARGGGTGGSPSVAVAASAIPPSS